MPFIFILALFSASSTPTMEAAQYCDCIFVNGTQLPMTEFRLKTYDAVFIGHVVKIELQDGATWGDWAMRERITEFHVMKQWKGSSKERILIKGLGTNCDYPFRIGETYLVFAYEVDAQALDEAGTLTADICDKEGTRLLSERVVADREDLLSAIRHPRSTSAPHAVNRSVYRIKTR